jgi:hypothetical protein
MEGSKLLFSCRTLELGWKNNQRNISCIPAGTYPMEWEYSSKFKQHLWELKNVPNRSEIKFHVANYSRQLNGCIAVGDLHQDLDRDGLLDLRNSRITLDRIHGHTQGLTQSSLIVYGDGRDS